MTTVGKCGVSPDVEIGVSGELAVIGEGARLAMGMRNGLWRLGPSRSENVLLLERCSETSARPERVILAGDLSGASLLDVANLLHVSRKSGALTVVSGRGCRGLLFEQGQVVSARSEAEEDSLAVLLYRDGRIDQAQLADLLAQGPRRQVRRLLQLGFPPSEIEGYVRQQILEIFFGAMLQEEGSFYFATPGQPEHFPGRAPLSTEALLLEALRRADEVRDLRAAFGDEKTTVALVVPMPSHLDLGPDEERVLHLLQRALPIPELVRLSRLGELRALRAITALVGKGVARAIRATEPPPPAPPLDPQLERLVDAFNEAFREIVAAMESPEDRARLRAGVSAFLSSYGYPDLFRYVAVNADGSLAKHALLANLLRASAQNKPSYLCAGLNELLLFHIYQARGVLGRQREQALTHRVNALLSRIPAYSRE